MSRRRIASPHRLATATLAIVAAVALLCLPGTAPADLDDDIAAAFDEFINGLIGDEVEGLGVEGYAPIPPIDPYPAYLCHWEVTLIGLALCSPTDPWAPPTPVPVPPGGVYECDSAAVVDAVVTPGETSADILITVDPVFLDFVIERDYGLCPWWEPGSGPPVTSDGYMLIDATITATVELEVAGGCVQATLVPGSVDVSLGENTREMHVQGDGCVDFYFSIFSEAVWNALNPVLETALEEIIIGLMGDVSQLLCDLTPASESTWGSVKILYRSAPEGGRE